MADRRDAPAKDPDAVADELYAATPEEFTGLRDDYAKAARDRGDRDAARQISALRKPTISAWLINQLVRSHPDDIEALLELGAGLREAQASLQGDELRALSQQRRQVINGLVRQALQLAVTQGRPVNEQASRDLAQTLEAALSDDDAAGQLRTARLTAALVPTADFGSVRPTLHVVRNAPTTPAAPSHRSQPAAGPAMTDAARARNDTLRRDAEAAAQETRAAAKAAQRELMTLGTQRDAIDKLADALAAQAAELRQQIDELTGQLNDVHDELVAVRKDQQRARTAMLEAERAARASQRAAEVAAAKLDALDD
jgi:DNA repair exonuclease SbcCD ATPase subunit